MHIAFRIPIFLLVAGCARFQQIGEAPAFTPPVAGVEHTAMMTYGLPQTIDETPQRAAYTASLWTGDRGSLLGDRRAMEQGDILTVVIEINDSAQISNSSDRSRSGSEAMSVPDFLGLPEQIEELMPDGTTLNPGVTLSSSSDFNGNGSVRRNEQLTLRVAATITNVLPNGVLEIEGSQEVRVNFELRELLVTGFVRPADISRQNEITYDKIASARISYGGRGQISDVQQPRYGQQAADIILPF
jgi:flagellar L-ring protein FlgH